MYEIRIKDAAISDLHKLDKKIAKRILKKIKWIAANADMIDPAGLRGDLAGFSKSRVGDYRIIYELLAADEVLIVHYIGHRSEIYNK